MNREACPDSTVLSRCFSESLDPDLVSGDARATELVTQHLPRCASCRADWQALHALRALSKELPVTLPGPAQRAAQRERLLSAARHTPVGARVVRDGQRRLRVTLAAAGLLCAVGAGALGYSLRTHGLPPRIVAPSERAAAPRERPAVIHSQGASGPARYLDLGPAQDQIVRLTEGTVLVESRRLQPGERMRVVTGDSEVEVHGTVFEVRARLDHLEAVRVLRGEVGVRVTGRPERRLKAGELWATDAETPPAPPAAAPASGAPTRAAPPPPAPTAPPARAPRPPAAPAHRAAPSRAVQERLEPAATPAPPAPSTPAASPSTPAAERAFNEGYAALRVGRYPEAIAALQKVMDESGPSELADDAAFWQAVATLRAGDAARAMVRLRSFLGKHPDSAHTGEAAAILGWQLLRAGRAKEAAPFFQIAAQDRVSEVRESGRQGLARTGAQP